MKIDQNLKNNQKKLLEKIIAGTASVADKIIVHTAPHHDDIILSYHAYAMKHWQQNRNHVMYMTSGSHGVSDACIMKFIAVIDESILKQAQAYSYQQILKLFAIAYDKNNRKQMLTYKLMMIAQFIVDIFQCEDNDAFKNSLQKLHIDLQSCKNSKKYTPEIVKLKERIRASESDCKWMICQGSLENINHFSSQFYYTDNMNFDVAMELDIQRCVHYLQTIKPDVMTVSLDPCGIGPKNHFLTLQVVAAALSRLSNKTIQIIGYRNVWSSFDLDETSMIVPVFTSEMHDMQSIFLHCFTTQKNTVFVGSEIDGNFAKQMQQIYTMQLQQVQNILGENLMKHGVDLLQGAVGAIFLKELTVDELLAIADGKN